MLVFARAAMKIEQKNWVWVFGDSQARVLLRGYYNFRDVILWMERTIFVKRRKELYWSDMIISNLFKRKNLVFIIKVSPIVSMPFLTISYCNLFFFNKFTSLAMKNERIL